MQYQEEYPLNFPIGLSLSDKFKLLRDQENLSQRALAVKIDIPPTTIAGIETGKGTVISGEIFNKFVESDDLAKYAFWLLNDNIDDETIDEMLAFRGKDQETDEPTPDDHQD